MAFAGRCGLSLDLSSLAGDDLSVLFNEELGAVIQVHAAQANAILTQLSDALPACVQLLVS